MNALSAASSPADRLMSSFVSGEHIRIWRHVRGGALCLRTDHYSGCPLRALLRVTDEGFEAFDDRF